MNELIKQLITACESVNWYGEVKIHHQVLKEAANRIDMLEKEADDEQGLRYGNKHMKRRIRQLKGANEDLLDHNLELIQETQTLWNRLGRISEALQIAQSEMGQQHLAGCTMAMADIERIIAEDPPVEIDDDQHG